MAQTRIRIGKQNEKSAVAGSIIRTDVNNEQEYVAPGTAGQVLQIVGGIPVWTTPVAVGNLFSITDGTNTQPIDATNVMTFLAGNGLTSLVSATDTVTYAVKLSTDAGQSLSFGTDGGVFYNAPDVVTGATWSDATNSLTLSFTEGVNVSIPIIDTVANFIHTHTLTDGTNSTTVTNGDTITYTGTNGITATIGTDSVDMALPAGTANGDILVWNSTTNEYEPATQASQISFNITDGTTTEVVNDAETITFANSGNVIKDVAVSATNTVTVIATEVNDTFGGLTSGTDVTLTATPIAGAILKVYRNGMKMVEGASNDYTVSGTTITFTTAFGISGGATGSEVVEVNYFTA